MQDPLLESVLEAIASEAATGGPHLISADELRAAGALDVPAAWRKSLRVERDLFSDLGDDEEPHPADQDPSPDDEDDEAVDDLP